MLAWLLLPITLCIPILNRYWRGDGNAPKLLWYSFMVALGAVFSGDIVFTGIWGLLIVGYAGLAWQSMFSAVHGNPPGRKDHWSSEWMQTFAFWIADQYWPRINSQYYYRFGMIYGAIRALPMIPSVFLMSYYTNSVIPLCGLAFLGMGCVYRWGGIISKYFGVGGSISVPVSEILMGELVREYLLISLFALSLTHKLWWM